MGKLGGHLLLVEEDVQKPGFAPLRLTKFEHVHVLGARACELASGHEAKVSCVGILDPLSIATREFDEGLLDLQLVRTFPSGAIKTFNASEAR